MTEVASLLPADHRLTSVRRYEAGPPEGLELVEPGETFATTKEEEWVSKKKTEVTNTKQIETRVKRQVVLEDGKVVDDSGPMVTTNTTEDTETQEHHQTELRKLGDQDDGTRAITDEKDDSNKWVSVPNPDGVVREVKEKKVLSREETEEIKEVEDVQHYGDITDEDFLAAVRSGRQDLRSVLRTVSKDGQAVVSTGPRLVHESSRSKKVTDTEDRRDLSSVLPDGKIVTESKRTTEHEEVLDDELPEDAPERDFYKESSQRYKNTRDQEEIDYLADGAKVGHAMKYRTETMEVEKRGDERDEPDFDSLSARIRRRNGRQQLRYRGFENGQSPLDRKDALTRRPLDFDQEEETRKAETSKWLEHHFGSESRSSSSIVDDEDPPPKTSFFNVTIKSQPVKQESPSPPPPPAKPFVTTVRSPTVRSPVFESPPPRPSPIPGYVQSDYYQGISQWSERKRTFSPSPDYNRPTRVTASSSPVPRREVSPVPSPVPDYRLEKSPSPILKRESSPYQREVSPSPVREFQGTSPTPPQRKRVVERRQKESAFSASLIPNGGRPADPPPDYSPPSPEKKLPQKTRFAPDPPKSKSKNIIGQSIRKLVGKIRSASAERKAKQKAKRSPSPSYQKGHVIDNINHESRQPVQRYYLGEDPFAGSIYGRENKYDGVKPARSSRKQSREETARPIDQQRSHSTLGRFSKSTSRLSNTHQVPERNSQTLPRHLTRKEPTTRSDLGHPKSNSTINVSFVNTLSHPAGPPKPARTFKSNLSRSRSLNVHSDNQPRMYTSTPHLNRLDRNHEGLKSPGLISSLSRSQRDLDYENNSVRSRFARNDTPETDNRRVFLKGLKDRAPELFKTLHEDEDNYRPAATSHHRNKYNGDIYEPPTRLRDTQQTPQSILRRGSNSSTDYSETYHTTTRNDNPMRPSVTNTVKSFSKKTIPSRDGRSLETIQSSEVKSVTKSQQKHDPSVKFYETERTYSSGSPVVIEVRNSSYRK